MAVGSKLVSKYESVGNMKYWKRWWIINDLPSVKNWNSEKCITIWGPWDWF